MSANDFMVNKTDEIIDYYKDIFTKNSGKILIVNKYSIINYYKIHVYENTEEKDISIIPFEYTPQSGFYESLNDELNLFEAIDKIGFFAKTEFDTEFNIVTLLYNKKKNLLNNIIKTHIQNFKEDYDIEFAFGYSPTMNDVITYNQQVIINQFNLNKNPHFDALSIIANTSKINKKEIPAKEIEQFFQLIANNVNLLGDLDKHYLRYVAKFKENLQ